MFPGLAILVAVFGFNLRRRRAARNPGGRRNDGARPLRIRDLTLGFRTYAGTVEVLHGISLNIGKGERVALVGESGSGKSVTARIVLGLLQSLTSARVAGLVEFDGRDLQTLSERERHGAARHRACR